MGVLRHVSEVGSRAGDCLTFLGDFSTPWRARSAKTSKMAVKTADKPRRPAYNEPKGNFRQPTLVLLCFAVLWLGLLRRGSARAAVGYTDSRGTHGNPVSDANDTSEPLSQPRGDTDHGV